MSSEIQITYELSITPGRTDEIREIIHEMVAFNHEGEPGTTAYNVFLRSDEARFVYLERFADPEAFLHHGRRFLEGPYIAPILERTNDARLCIHGTITPELEAFLVDADLEYEHWNLVDGFTR